MSQKINTRQFMIYPILINSISCFAGLFCLSILIEQPNLFWLKQWLLGCCVAFSFMALLGKSVSRRYYELIGTVYQFRKLIPNINPHTYCIVSLVNSAVIKFGFPCLVVWF